MVNQTTNVVENVCYWDGDTTQWTPPENNLMLVQEDTPTMLWQLNADKTDYVLVEQLGKTDIGFTWDGTVCTTNKPKPQL